MLVSIDSREDFVIAATAIAESRLRFTLAFTDRDQHANISLVSWHLSTGEGVHVLQVLVHIDGMFWAKKTVHSSGMSLGVAAGQIEAAVTALLDTVELPENVRVFA